MVPMREFSARLKQRRESLGLTQLELGEKIGVSSQTISAYERNGDGRTGGKTPTLDKAMEIANVLETSLDWLCGQDINRGSGRAKTYSDAISLLESLLAPFYASIEKDYLSYLEIDIGPAGTPVAALKIHDEILADFFERMGKMNRLLLDGTIDAGLYNAWLSGEKAKFSDTLLPELALPGQKGG